MEFPGICEVAMHELRLNIDSSFNLRLYCAGDTASTLKEINKSGKWEWREDSTIICSSKDFILQLKVVSENLLSVIQKDNVQPMLTYQRVTH